MTIYSNARALAGRMLQQFGEQATLRRAVASVGGSPSIAGTSVAPETYPCRLAVFPIDQRDIDGTFIKAGDFRVMVAAEGLAIEPTTTDHVICSAGTLAIVDAGKFAPAGVVTHYRMVCRK